jgi:hypothetical protein
MHCSLQWQFGIADRFMYSRLQCCNFVKRTALYTAGYSGNLVKRTALSIAIYSVALW